MFDLVAAICAEQARRQGSAPVGYCRPPVPAAVQPPSPKPQPGKLATAVSCAFPDILFVDVETYFDRDYSLSKLSLTEYLRDPRFAVLGVGVGFRGRRHWLSAEAFRERAAKTPWHQLTVVAHHAAFDAAVLAWHFGIRPKRWGDTLAMARGAYPQREDYSLGALAETFGHGRKMDTLDTLAGVRELDDAQQVALRAYNDNDLLLLERLYAQLIPNYPESELELIDLTIRQCVEPCLILDPLVLQAQIDADRLERDKLLAVAGLSLEDLRSDRTFAAKLEALGVTAPTKVSPQTGKQSFAFSAKDAEFVALAQHPDEEVRALVAARQNAMSNLTSNRAGKMLTLANLGPLAVELNYYGAATGRFSGGGGINLQNLPHDSALRQAICAQPGHLLVSCDSAQIEARILAWFAGESPLLEAFQAGRDVYCEFASIFFNREITKADAVERKVGKTAILGLGYGMGTKKFAENLKTSGIRLSDEEVSRLVQTYRSTYTTIPKAWRSADAAIKKGRVPFGRLGLELAGDRIHLPNGMSLHYPELRAENDGQWRYTGRRGRETLYGGKIIENVIQALARIVVMAQQLAIAREFRVVFSVHDEVVCCVPEEAAETCKARLLNLMAMPPEWAPDLHLACEAAVGKNFGEL